MFFDIYWLYEVSHSKTTGCRKSLINVNRCAIYVIHTHPKSLNPMKSTKKDVTCAVRIPRALYDNLSEAAEIEGSSLSDVIRSAIVNKIQMIRDGELQRRIKAETVRKQLEDLVQDSPESRGRVEDILKLMEAS